MLKIHITGGAGFIGLNLALYLQTRGYQVSASDVRSRPQVLSAEIHYASADLLDAEGLANLLADVRPDVVVHLGARTDLHGAGPADYAANTDGVRNLIAACRCCPKLRRVLFASSRMVCRIDYVPTDFSDYCPPNAYGQSKVEAEQIVKTDNLGFEWSIFRPTSIWGPHFDIPYRTFFDQIRSGRYFHPGKFNPGKSFGYVGNSVFQIDKLIEAPADKVQGRTFYLGDYSPIHLREWADMIAAKSNPPRKILTAPMLLLRAGARVGDLLSWAGMKDRFPLTTFRLNNLITDMIYPQLEDLEAITGALPYSLEAGTDATIKWLDMDCNRSRSTNILK